MSSCPRCHSPDVGRASFFWSELPQAVALRVPYRCRSCGARFLDSRGGGPGPAAAAERPATPDDELLALVAPAVKDRRAFVRYSCDLVVSELAVGGREKAVGPGRVLNVSCGGVQIVSPQRVAPGSTVHVRIKTVGDRSSRRLSAQVLGALALSDGRWALACRFREPIDRAELDGFFQG